MSQPPFQSSGARRGERGNVLFIILIAIVLIGTLTAVIQNTSSNNNANIDDETMLIRATEVKRYASELERAVVFVREHGVSEEDIRFAQVQADAAYGAFTDTENQIFAPKGGGANYRAPSPDVAADPSSAGAWEFYATSAIPGAGRDTRSELVAVLPNVSAQFCTVINGMNDLSVTQPADAGAACIHAGAAARFAGTYVDDGDTGFNDDIAGITPVPALQGCVQCSSDSAYHFYHVLLAR